ncbi:MAG: helix-turn-helix domain-containing protein [Pseudomonadota bacterium]
MYVTPDQRARHAETRRQSGTAQAQTIEFRSDRPVYFEGDTAASLYLVKRGVLRLSRVLADGRRQIIAFGYPGDVVGFPSDGAHRTDCDVLEAAELEVIPARILAEKGEWHPRKDRILAAALAEVSAMQDHFMMLGLKTAKEKVASFLVTLSNRTGTPLGKYVEFTLPMSRADIAAFLGLTIETVSRQVTALRKAGIIETDGARTIIVTDPESLEEAAS